MQQLKAIILFAATMRLMPAAATPVVVEQYPPHAFTLSAQGGGNPFDVDVRGDFTGPDGTHISIPGFYAGGNVWKIRFSPTKPGRWSMTTVSQVAALNAHTDADIECRTNSNPAIHGGLSVDPVNRHHFIHEDGSR